MRCSRCQHENPAQAKFCEECATPLGRTCANSVLKELG
ncbi:MAG: zinc-ribbon domain-containing protein [Candidatus Rokubacteria bacterium]|nr:zinc-ribbon domain-containing protein [Candidatus Rokubacteria bacterium]